MKKRVCQSKGCVWPVRENDTICDECACVGTPAQQRRDAANTPAIPAPQTPTFEVARDVFLHLIPEPLLGSKHREDWEALERHFRVPAPQTIDGTVEVTQADRDAAAEVYRRFRYGANDCVNQAIQSGIIAGDRDNDPIVLFMAAHAQQSRLSTRAVEDERETWDSINQWCDDTFGKATIPQIIARAKEEFIELETEGADHAIEAADVVICLCRIPGFADALQRKMAINRKRKWRLTGGGTGYHIPDTALTTGGSDNAR